MVPVDGGDREWGDIGKKRRAANVGGGGVDQGLVAPRVLRSSDALNGDVEPQGKAMYLSEWPRGASILLEKPSEICPGTDL